MEKLTNLSQTDINNGVLNHMLANVGIHDVQEYVKHFHQETEELVLEEFRDSETKAINDDELIIHPTDIYSWIKSFRPCLNDSTPPPLSQLEQDQRPPLPTDVYSWLKAYQPHLNDDVAPTPTAASIPEAPTDLKSWMKSMIPNDTTSVSDPTVPASNEDVSTLNGDLGTWLFDWSKSLNEQPPPASLDTWLKGLIPENMHEPIGKAKDGKGRLNIYLNAAQKVLSEHGYDVATEIKASPDVQKKVGIFGNVKGMYFLWRTLDKNNDRKITVEDVQIMLEEMGLGFISKYVAKTLFDMVDTNHDGQLQFRDFIALMSIIKALVGAVGSAKTTT